VQGYETHAFAALDIQATWRLPMRKLVVSSWLRDQIAEVVGDQDIVVVPNGIDRRQFDAAPRELGSPPTVGLSYSPAPVKGTATAFGAIRLARRSIPDLKVVCYGAGRRAREIPIPDHAAFHRRPSQTELRDIYASADLWLCASRQEGFALPPLEAMACRCPVVVTRCGGPSEFVEDGRNGHFVDVGDATAMAERIVATLSDKAAWKTMSNAAYDTAGRFDVEQSSLRFERAILGVEDSLDAHRDPLATATARVGGGNAPSVTTGLGE
jgi:glycosyltransferase involved in cell wall biosynthesis